MGPPDPNLESCETERKRGLASVNSPLIESAEKRPEGRTRSHLGIECVSVLRGSWMKCQKCGSENPEHAVYCGMCTSPVREVKATDASLSDRGRFHRTESSLGFAGSLLILAGIFALVQAVVFLFASPFWFWTETSLLLCGSLEIFLGIIAIYGGIHTIHRTSLRLSISAAAAAIASVGLAASLFLGAFALMMILSSRSDFRN